MSLDVTEIRDFYRRSLGATVRRLVRRHIKARWSSCKGQSVFGLGYAIPYLSAYQHEALRVGALMPAAQGTILWPAEGAVRCALVEDDALPLPDESVDRMLVIHALEMAASPQHTLREIWRVLTPEAKVLVIVPNRRGLWARRDTTPFGHGRPYSRGQIERLMTGALFGIEQCSTLLAVPPVDIRPLWRGAPAIERIGSRIWPMVSGLVVVEARKEISGLIAKPLARRIRASLRPILVPAEGSRRHAALAPPAYSRDKRKIA